MNPGSHMKATNEDILSAYAELKSCKGVAEKFGMCPQSVHERLAKLGKTNKPNLFTDEETNRLAREYLAYSSIGKLDDLARSMGRTKNLICRQARDLGLTDPKIKRPWSAVWKYMSDEAALTIWEHFKKSKLGLGRYCKKYKYDPLGFSRTMKEKFSDEYENVIELKTPKQSLYRLGRALEYRARDEMKKRGYFVMRSPASKSPIDLVAIRAGEILFVQCKRSGVLCPSEWNELWALTKTTGAVPIMARLHESGRGTEYFRLTAPKDGSRKGQPMEPFIFNDVRPRMEIDLCELDDMNPASGPAARE